MAVASEFDPSNVQWPTFQELLLPIFYQLAQIVPAPLFQITERKKKQSRFEKLVYGFITLQQMNGIDKWNVII